MQETSFYLPPELCSGAQFVNSIKVDDYRFGIIILELLLGTNYMREFNLSR